MPKAESVLADLASRRAVLMDQVQAIDDDAAELMGQAEIDLQDDEAKLARQRQQLQAHWGHLMPDPKSSRAGYPG